MNQEKQERRGQDTAPGHGGEETRTRPGTGTSLGTPVATPTLSADEDGPDVDPDWTDVRVHNEKPPSLHSPEPGTGVPRGRCGSHSSVEGDPV